MTSTLERPGSQLLHLVLAVGANKTSSPHFDGVLPRQLMGSHWVQCMEVLVRQNGVSSFCLPRLNGHMKEVATFIAILQVAVLVKI